MDSSSRERSRYWMVLFLITGGLGLFGGLFFIPISMRWLYFAVMPPVLVHVAVLGLLVMVFRRCGELLNRLETLEERTEGDVLEGTG
jgi:hypothetical protein